MSYGQWIVGGILAAIILFNFSMALRSVRKANAISKFMMTLLIDEFSYRQQRTKFLKLIETTKVANSLVLYYAAQLDLEDSAERNAQTKVLFFHMWKLNQRALQTGQSITDFIERVPDSSEDLRGRITDPYPNHERNTATGSKAAKLAVGIVKFRLRARRFLGM